MQLPFMQQTFLEFLGYIEKNLSQSVSQSVSPVRSTTARRSISLPSALSALPASTRLLVQPSTLYIQFIVRTDRRIIMTSYHSPRGMVGDHCLELFSQII